MSICEITDRCFLLFMSKLVFVVDFELLDCFFFAPTPQWFNTEALKVRCLFQENEFSWYIFIV